MSDLKEKSDTPIDPLSGLDFELPSSNSDPLGLPQMNSEPNIPEEKIISSLNQDEKFRSREPLKKAIKSKPKTYSLFPNDLAVIRDSLKEYEKLAGKDYDEQPSASDIVRSALEVFSLLTPQERIRYITENYRGNKK
ncbi:MULTISPECIES: hypothetical protein [Aquimarina]|uniref:Uncharacterized protein n=1 Tax=Aquimarina algiphila TaxID=2047982 RepID=A0A554VCI4_9FLAO|nr:MULTISPECIES: hypothetical protein [Aquimarina]TSE04400.1 hypothetical protein FOF46_26605 [Aquimarina algiphila]